jgi:phosphoglycerate dehydrogenase-like enzyme
MRSKWTTSTRVVDRSADACFARAKHERDLGSARRLDVVHLESLGIDHRDARSRGIPVVVTRGNAGRSLAPS